MKSDCGNAAEADETIGVAAASSTTAQRARSHARDRPAACAPRMCVCNTERRHKSGAVPAIHELFARASPSFWRGLSQVALTNISKKQNSVSVELVF